jgi:hypothetical protein
MITFVIWKHQVAYTGAAYYFCLEKVEAGVKTVIIF